jgi:hypothetical protein
MYHVFIIKIKYNRKNHWLEGLEISENNTISECNCQECRLKRIEEKITEIIGLLENIKIMCNNIINI